MTPPVLADWVAAADHFTWRGHRIAFWQAGAGRATPLLLIHGFPTSAWDWHALWPALVRRGPVLALDLLGFGLSDKPRDARYSLCAQADLCEALLAARGIAHYDVLAHDYGDSVAQELISRRAEAGPRPVMRSACLLNGGLFPEAHHPLPIQRLLASRLGPLLVHAVSRRRFGASLQRIFGPHTPPGERDIDAFWYLMTRAGGRRALPRLLAYLHERRTQRARWTAALQSGLPLRLIDGTADPISGACLVRRYRELVPQPDVVELAGIGHYPQLEAADAVCAAFLAFRERVDTSPPGAA